MPQANPVISLCIPTFKEQDFIVRTINSLKLQTLWPITEIVVADYDPDGNRQTVNAIFKGCGYENNKIRILKIERAGVGYARHSAIMAAHGKYIVNFDADCYYNRADALDLMIRGLGGQVKVTHCASVVQREDMQNAEAKKFNSLYEARNMLLRLTKLPICYEQGMTMEKETYLGAGGYNDINVLEGPLLCGRIAMTYNGVDSFYLVPDVVIFTSARRGMGSNGLLPDLNYTNAYRAQDQPIKVK